MQAPATDAAPLASAAQSSSGTIRAKLPFVSGADLTAADKLMLSDDVRKQAFKLAGSGRYPDCISIEAALAEAGYPEVYVVLQEPALRKTLNELCASRWDSEASSASSSDAG